MSTTLLVQYPRVAPRSERTSHEEECPAKNRGEGSVRDIQNIWT